MFYKVQDIISTKRKITCKSDDHSSAFILKGFLICPSCGRKIRASFSQGTTKKHPYYHCSKGCKTRINAGLLNEKYACTLQQLQLSGKVTDLFQRILEEVNIDSERVKYLNDRKLLMRELKSQRQLVLRARRLFVTNKLKFDDFREIKKECQFTGEKFGIELTATDAKLKRLEKKEVKYRLPLSNMCFDVIQISIR